MSIEQHAVLDASCAAWLQCQKNEEKKLMTMAERSLQTLTQMKWAITRHLPNEAVDSLL